MFGILAVQMDLISRDQLIDAMSVWVVNKEKSLGQILRETGALDEDDHTLLESLVRRHIKAHRDDPQQSLAAVSARCRSTAI